MKISHDAIKKVKKSGALSGQLSRQTIEKELVKKDGMEIYTTLNTTSQVKRASIDITPTIVAMSANTGMLQNVYVKKSQYINTYYIHVKPKDTVLIVSNEYVKVPNYMAGYVTSRVSNVVNGFGHISTTIDPNWNGALLIALSNPTNRNIKIDVGTSTIPGDEKNISVVDKKTLATLTFHYLSEPIDSDMGEYKNMRLDLLNNVKYDRKKGVRAWIRKILYRKRRKYTDYFFEYLSANENDIHTREGWDRFLKEFSVFDKEYNKKQKNAFYFVTKENIIFNIYYYIENRKNIFLLIFVITAIVLYRYGYLEDNILNLISDFINLC